MDHPTMTVTIRWRWWARALLSQRAIRVMVRLNTTHPRVAQWYADWMPSFVVRHGLVVTTRP